MDRYYQARITGWEIPGQPHLWTLPAPSDAPKIQLPFSSMCFVCTFPLPSPFSPYSTLHPQLWVSPLGGLSFLPHPRLPGATPQRPPVTITTCTFLVISVFLVSSSREGTKTYSTWFPQHSAWHRIINHYMSTVGRKGVWELPQMIPIGPMRIIQSRRVFMGKNNNSVGIWLAKCASLE